MEKIKLKDYLKRAMELEKNKYELESILLKLNRKYEPEVIKIENKKFEDESYVNVLAYNIVGLVISFILALFSKSGLTAFLIMVFCGAISLIVGFCAISNKNAQNGKNRQEQKIKNANIANLNKKSIGEANKKNNTIAHSANEIQKTLVDTQKELDLLYSKDIIYSKYRNIIAIASIYEYLDSGRCEQLEGADGAYNIYEMEVRLDRIITKLDVVINNLEQIKNNQYYLYSAINELKPYIENTSKAIIENTEKLNEIGVNTAVTAYTTQVIERNQYYGRNWNDGHIYDDRINLKNRK